MGHNLLIILITIKEEIYFPMLGGYLSYCLGEKEKLVRFGTSDDDDSIGLLLYSSEKKGTVKRSRK